MSPCDRLSATARVVTALFSLSLILTLPLFPGCARGAQMCGACGREIHPALRVTLQLEGRRDLHACCPRCALHFRNEGEVKVVGVRVSDYVSGGPLAIESAWLVEGSDETPCVHGAPPAGEGGVPLHRCYDRCVPSLIAFAGEAAARAFMVEHGGTLRPPGEITSADSSAASAAR
jgi:hypothetical protein